MKFFLMAAVLFDTCLLSAAAQQAASSSPAPILIENSLSPDGRKDIIITDTNGDGEATGLVTIQNIKTEKSLGTFEWSGFGYHPDAKTFEVLWRPDSRAFAIRYESSRGYISCEVYMLTNDGRCREVRLPAIVARTAKKYGLKTDDKGGEHPEKWLPDNRLVIVEYNRAWSINDWQDRMRPYRVTIRLPEKATLRRLRASIESIRPSS